MTTEIERIIPKSYIAYLYKTHDETKAKTTTKTTVYGPPQPVIINTVQDNDGEDEFEKKKTDEDRDNSQYSAENLNDDKQQVEFEKKTSIDEDKFWGVVALLAWRCKSEGEAKLHHITRNLKPNEIAYLKEHIGTYAYHVEDNIKKYGWLSKAPTSQVKNFTYHVVGMGQQMYLASIGDPEFIQYMWDSDPPEYQNLYDMLNHL